MAPWTREQVYKLAIQEVPAKQHGALLDVVCKLTDSDLAVMGVATEDAVRHMVHARAGITGTMGGECERWLDRLNALPLSEEEKGKAFVLIVGNQDIKTEMKAVLTCDKTTSEFLVSVVKALLQQAAAATQPPAAQPGRAGSSLATVPEDQVATRRDLEVLQNTLSRQMRDMNLQQNSPGQRNLSSVSYEQFFKGREPALKQVTLQQVASMLGIQWPGQPEGWGSPPQFPNKSVAEVDIMLPDMLAFLENAAQSAGSLYKVHDTHKVRYLDGSAPDITVTQMGFDVGSFNAVMVVELQKGSMDNLHRGKALYYNERLLDANTARSHALCMVSNCESIETYVTVRKPADFEHFCSSSVQLIAGGGWHFICKLLRTDCRALRLQPPLLAGQELRVTGQLGLGRYSIVYSAEMDGEVVACKVFGKDGNRAYDAELAVLSKVKRNHIEGLPLLLAPDPSLEGETTPNMLVTTPVASPLQRLTLGGLQRIFSILGHLHTKVKLVHRDIEPKHLAVRKASGPVCLLDLGCAAELSEHSSGPTLHAATRYSGTLLFAADDVLEAIERGGPCAPHPRQDMVALVKTVCTLMLQGVAEEVAFLAERVQKHLEEGPDLHHGEVVMVREFWKHQLGGDTLAFCEWRELVQQAFDIPDLGGEGGLGRYEEAAGKLRDRLARLMYPD